MLYIQVLQRSTKQKWQDLPRPRTHVDCGLRVKKREIRSRTWRDDMCLIRIRSNELNFSKYGRAFWEWLQNGAR